MTQITPQVTRETRRQQLLAMWKERGKNGQAAVLSLCHQVLPQGESLRAGMSVIDVILDHEYGPPQDSQSSASRQSA